MCEQKQQRNPINLCLVLNVHHSALPKTPLLKKYYREMEPPINQSMRVCLGYWVQHASTINMNHLFHPSCSTGGWWSHQGWAHHYQSKRGWLWSGRIRMGAGNSCGKENGSPGGIQLMKALQLWGDSCWVDDGYTPLLKICNFNGKMPCFF